MSFRRTTQQMALGSFHDDYTNVESAPSIFDVSGQLESLVAGEGGHYGYPNFPVDRDVGGNFDLRYSRFVNQPVDLGHIRAFGVYRNISYKGKWMATVPWNNYPSSAPNGAAYGATAFDKMKPDRPQMSLLNSIYELKDVPGMLKQRFLNHGLSSIGDYYLALKFGWEPLLRDVRDLVNTQRNAQKILDQLIRDEGRPVRRKIQLAATQGTLIETSGLGAGPTLPAFNSYFYDGSNSRFTYREQPTSRIWASAQFRYWLPPGPRDINWRRWMLARIFGLRPTPSVVYKAIPWSWLVDWFSNVGHVISNMDTSLVDRLAADYFYVMRHDMTTISRTSTLSFWRAHNMELFPATSTAAAFVGSKTRVHGDPFGFATAQNSLSGVQLSILGALGLSRLR